MTSIDRLNCLPESGYCNRTDATITERRLEKFRVKAVRVFTELVSEGRIEYGVATQTNLQCLGVEYLKVRGNDSPLCVYTGP